MKYYIEVDTPDIKDNIISETYESSYDDFKKICDVLSDPKVVTGKLDFITKSGDFVVINELVMQKSVVYIKVVDK